ncbi:MAG: zinc-dependent metalloprotease [Draconibacterium sp.]
MNKKLLIVVLTLSVTFLLSSGAAVANYSIVDSWNTQIEQDSVGASKQGNDKKSTDDEKEKEVKKADVAKKSAKKSDYEKLFEKPHETVEGLLKLHKIDGKVYCEFPDEFLGKDFAIASTVIKTSENGHSIVGEKPHPIKHVRFEMLDSVIFMTDAEYYLDFKNGDQIAEAYKQTSYEPLAERFDVKVKTPDQKAYVIDLTNFFLADNKDMNPFGSQSFLTSGGFVSRIVKFAKTRSLISGIKGFKDNVVIESSLSYDVSLTFMGVAIAIDKPYTALMSRSLFLLPEKKMDERIADPRIGFFTTRKMLYQDEKGTSKYYLAHRWRLEPKDEEAYLRGELVEPKEPIKFYIDNKFPQEWIPYIKAGIETWNIAFERAGYKNAIVAEEFPTGDSTFYIGDINYSCVYYAPSPNANSAGPSWVDPRTGEIINASIYLYHDIIKLLQDWRFLQTAQVDTRVREETFPEDLLGESIQYVVSHEMGHCLGLMHNMAASAAFPVDSLRSATFTQKYGTTPSIMDYARFNYIAQPGDEGLKLTPPALGEYDKYAIEWGYRYYGKADAQRDKKILGKMVSDKVGDPVYRYGKQQVMVTYDPSSLTEDLGDDPVKAAMYGIQNLKYILPKMDGWFKDFDPDYNYTAERYKALKKQYLVYMGHLFNTLGGVYLTEKYRGDDVDVYRSVSREKQRESLLYFMKEFKDMDWLMEPGVVRNLPLDQPFDLNMRPVLFRTILNKDEAIAYSAYLSDEANPYTPQEFYEDLIDIVFEGTQKGRSLTREEINTQTYMVETMVKNLAPRVSNSVSESSNSFAFQEEVAYLQSLESLSEINEYLDTKQPYACNSNPVAGFTPQKGVITGNLRNINFIRYNAIQEIEKLLSKKKNTGDTLTKNHYRYLLGIIK